MIEPPHIRSVSELLKHCELSPDKNKVDQIYLYLYDLIVTVQLLPLQRISEIEISDALGASRTPVREAMIRLSNDGLVKVVPKSGTYVNPINIDHYLEAAFMRTLIEVGVAGRAAMKWRDEPQNQRLLTQPLEEQKIALQNEDYFAFAQSDEAFHFNIFCLARVPGIWQTVMRGQPDLSRIRHLKRVFKIRRSEEVLSEHQTIIAAIRSGSKESAEAAMQAHLGTFETEFPELSEHPLLVDYIARINEPTPRNARTFAANAEFAKQQVEGSKLRFKD